ncbi:MAG TPA: amino acid adenylation domain-containing protein [Candidatus Angelobacter sp.]
MAEHHAILDGWSVAMLLTQIFHLYFSLLEAKEKKIEAPASSFHEFVELERQTSQSEEARQYWQQQMDDLEVAQVFAKTGHAQGTLFSRQVEIPTTLFHQLKKLAAETGVSIKSVLLAAHIRVVSFVSGRKDIITGLVSNGRVETKDGERVLGLFLNTVPLRRKLSSGRWTDLVRETAAAEQALLPHRRYPLSKLQQNAGGIPLFDVTFNFVHFHVLREIKSAGLEILDTRGAARTNFALATSFAVAPAGSAVELTLNYDGTLLPQDRIAAIAGYYLTALKAMTDDPQGYYDSTSLLAEAEKQQLLEWNRTEAEYPQDTIHARFEQQAALTPENEAVVFEDQSMTFAELDRHAGRLAHHLHKLGVGPEAVVAMCMNRSMEMVIGVLAVLKAGGAYLPLDPDSPTDRLKFMLEDSRAKLVLTHAAAVANLPRHPSLPVVFVENTSADQPMLKTSDVAVEGRHPAYVIYTSGSTGQPKGVVITHSAIANHMNWVQESFPIGSADRVLQKTVFTFDAAVWEFHAPLLTGGRLVLAKPGGQQDPEYLLRCIQEEQISVLKLVPSQLRMLLEQGGLEKCNSVRRIYCGGEALSKELAAQCRFALPSARLYNFYGPTEATIDVAWSECCLGDDPVPIGRPIANTQLYILSDDMELLPVGTVGELFIAGVALARGYLNQPDLTADRFLPNPFSATPGERMYRTGDLVRCRKNGDLEYLGRRDHQVKVRGYRIELGEIESALAQLPAVQACVVMVREDRPGEKRLVAYVKAAPQAADLDDELRAHLRKSLPEYMVPSIVLLDHFPLTNSGKVNGKALPAPEAAGLERASLIAPRTELEQVLSGIFNDVLAVRSGIRDSFFDLGGHSLDAIRTLALIEKTTGNRISLADLFHNPTVEELAVFLQGYHQVEKWSCLVPLRKQGSRKPLYLVHPVGGNVVCYHQLTGLLGPEQPVYAFQSKGLNPDLQPHSEITEMATAYVYELLQADAQGPYLVGGWSMGGVVAFEMARQLRERNLPVALLCLIDSYPEPPGSRSGPEGREHLLWAFASDLGLSIADLPVIQPNSARENFDAVFSSIIEIAKTKRLISPEIELSQAERLFRVFSENLQAARAHRALPCESELVLFQAQNRSASHDDPAQAWRPLVTGDINSYIVPGNHYSILKNSTALGILTKYLEACLERVNSNFESALAR